jgi:transposase
MILLPHAVRVYVATRPVRLNKSFDGLTNEVRHVLRLDPLSGHVFVFINRRRNMAKLLLWTRGGFTLIAKRLERGTFAFSFDEGDDRSHVELGAHELSMLLEGIALADTKTSKRWSPSRGKRARRAA